jgi:CrcB protein
LALGIVLVVLVERFPPARYARPFVATGFLGAYTTYSTFAVDTDVLVQHGHVATAAAYVVATMVGGFVAAWLGVSLARARR